jgi:hypothetical protein
MSAQWWLRLHVLMQMFHKQEYASAPGTFILANWAAKRSAVSTSRHQHQHAVAPHYNTVCNPLSGYPALALQAGKVGNTQVRILHHATASNTTTHCVVFLTQSLPWRHSQKNTRAAVPRTWAQGQTHVYSLLITDPESRRKGRRNVCSVLTTTPCSHADRPQ